MRDITGIRYISMPRDRHRRTLLRKILVTLPYESRMVPGVEYDPRNPEFEGYTAAGVADYLQSSPKRVKGVVGTWIAHSRALEDVKHREGITVVLEDDFVCRPGFFAEALRMVNRFDQDFDLILFDSLGIGPAATDEVSPNVYQSNGKTYPYYYGAHCVLVNNRSIPKILEIKRAFEIKDVDGFFLGTHTGLTTYLFYTGKCSQVFFGSHNSMLRQGLLTQILGTLSWAFWTRFAYVFGKAAHAPGRDAVAG